MKKPNDNFLDLRALSEYSCISKDALRDHIKCRGLPAFLVGGKFIIRKSDFDRWVLKHRYKPDVDPKAKAQAIIKKTMGR